jgi:hypothetical protein
MTSPVIQFKRGSYSQLPGLRPGEPGFTTDRYDLFVGLSSALEDNKFFGSHRYWRREDGTISLRFAFVDKNGNNNIQIKSPDTLSGVTTYVLPETPLDQFFLKTDSDGVLSWSNELPSLIISGISTFRSNVAITTNTESYNKDTGALVIDGGLGVEKNANIGGRLDVTGISTLSDGAYVNNINIGISSLTEIDTSSGNLVLDSATGYTIVDDSLSVSGIVTASTYYGEGGALTLGAPTDANIVVPGALNTFATSTKIVDGIDDLNELAYNIIRNTAVTNVDFSSNPTVGGSPLNINLSVTYSGNANRYDIDWGDGSATFNAVSSTISHTYNQPSGGQFPIIVTAKNSSGVGAGSSQTVSKINYITVYTPDPIVTFELYRGSSGGSAISGNDLYVIEGQPLYLDNNTTNTSGATVNYTMNWGDGSSNDSIADDSANGGVSGSRLVHTWIQGTNSGTSLDTLTLTLNAHNTANPAVIPATGTVSVKVYDDSPTAPDGLSSKTLSNVTSVGTSPKLASGFTDSTGGTTLVAGDNVNRVTGGTAEAGPITTFAYNANSGTLTANVNGSSDGSVSLTSGDDSGTYTSLVITSESDYQLLNSSGSTVTFASSTYYPGLYKGFKAKVSKSVSSLNTGVNSMQLLHSATGNTNIVEFVKDDMTATPVVSVAGATLIENVAGTYRYISGIPYYNTGSPSLTLSGVTVTNLVSQTYTNQTNIVEVDTGTNQEGTSSAGITDSDYTYTQINGSSSMLTGGIPNANTGTSSPYSIGSLTVPITSSSVRTVDRVRVRARNVNGISGYSSDIPSNIQVHTAAQSGISEVAISVSGSLGNGVYTDNGKRIYDFGPGITTNTPSYNSATNFYTNNLYSESSSPAGISTTREAVVRLGSITHNQVNYSTGYLPAGPDFSSGRSGTQYFTFAFRRQVVANFDINITSSGISGLWIAAPGTSIDNTSTLNGWLRSDLAYAGSGVPGGNTGAGGNGSDGCAATSGDIISSGTSLSGSYTMTLGSENLSNSTGNVVLIRIALTSGQSITSLTIT